MPRPFLQQLEQKIQSLGGEDWVFDHIADGLSLRKIAEMLGCSRPYLYTWRDHGIHKERRREKWAAAQKASAESHAEEAGELLEDLSAKDLFTPSEVSLAKSRSEYRQWMASVRNPEMFGRQKDQASVVVNIGALHLDALRAAPKQAALPGAPAAQREAGEVVDAEVVEEESEA